MTRSDSRHPVLFIECKHGKAHAVWSLYEETRPKAKKEGKVPILAIQKTNHAGVILCIHSQDMDDVMVEWYKANANNPDSDLAPRLLALIGKPPKKSNLKVQLGLEKRKRKVKPL